MKEKNGEKETCSRNSIKKDIAHSKRGRGSSAQYIFNKNKELTGNKNIGSIEQIIMDQSPDIRDKKGEG
jgi:hypothetical protein